MGGTAVGIIADVRLHAKVPLSVFVSDAYLRVARIVFELLSVSGHVRPSWLPQGLFY